MVSWQTKTAKLLGRLTIRQALKRNVSVDDMRQQIAAVERFFPDVPDDVRVEYEPELEHCDAEWITLESESPERVILHLPGGAFMTRFKRSERVFLARLCRAANARGRLVFYRLAPEHPYPAALDDCREAYRQLLELGVAPENLFISGMSAGGSLALALLLSLRDDGDPMPAGAVLMSPAADFSDHGKGGSREENEKRDALLSLQQGDQIRKLYLGDRTELIEDPYVSPVMGDFTGLPPLFPGQRLGDPARRQPTMRRARPRGRRVGRSRDLGAHAARLAGAVVHARVRPRHRPSRRLHPRALPVTGAGEKASAARFMRRLRRDHAGLSRMLRAIDVSVDRLTTEPEAVQPFLVEAFSYLLGYQHGYHHPREDRLFGSRQHRPALAETLAKLADEHETGERETADLAEDLAAAAPDELRGAEGRRLAERIRAYIGHARLHMRDEEAVFYARAERVLDDSDWADIIGAGVEQDPLANLETLADEYPELAAYFDVPTQELGGSDQPGPLRPHVVSLTDLYGGLLHEGFELTRHNARRLLAVRGPFSLARAVGAITSDNLRFAGQCVTRPSRWAIDTGAALLGGRNRSDRKS